MALIGKAVAETPAVAADRIGVEGSRDFILYQRQVIAHAVADKVVGKAAAALMVLGGVREVYTDIISEPALAVLHKANIRVECVQIVSRIWNRNRTGWCPLETLCYELESPEAMYPVIQNFVERMRGFGS